VFHGETSEFILNNIYLNMIEGNWGRMPNEPDSDPT
jgi:hypothetical protein